MPSFNPVFGSLPTSIFAHMSGLCARHDAINLGQGFPDQDGPEPIRARAARALIEGPNQYPPMPGLPELRRAVSAHARAFYGLNYDPDGEVLVTSGGTEALAACTLALGVPGRPFVLVEPTYDSYRPMVEASGASVRSVQLEPPGWRLTEAALRAAIAPDTSAVLVNTPFNPLGRVFDREELESLARVVGETGAAVISDEVYEHLTYDGRPHISLASLPGMRARVLRIGSAGKIFSLTGWKVGWVTGPRELVGAATKAHQFLTFTTSPSAQLGVAEGLTAHMDFPLALTKRLQANRDRLSAALGRLGFEVLPCEGTYFMAAGISGLTNEKDFAFCERLIREAGVGLIPLSAFFKSGTPDTYVRFAFCKRRETIEEAIGRLERYFGSKQGRRRSPS
jgi:aspartate/methionine/tyrosine aminotransferase